MWKCLVCPQAQCHTKYFEHNIAIFLQKDFVNFETQVSMTNQGKLLKTYNTLDCILFRAYLGRQIGDFCLKLSKMVISLHRNIACKRLCVTWAPAKIRYFWKPANIKFAKIISPRDSLLKPQTDLVNRPSEVSFICLNVKTYHLWQICKAIFWSENSLDNHFGMCYAVVIPQPIYC